MNIVAITACQTGIAHTYMAAHALIKAAKKNNIRIKIETQGAMGIENEITKDDIKNADCVLIVSDIPIENVSRFKSNTTHNIPIKEVLFDVNKVILNYCKKANV
ncbi:PTS fructose transporter subunit IIB [Photobacterium sp. DNB23_23_1]